MNQTALIAGHDLVYEVGSRRLLDGVSVKVDAGEILTVIGPNGAGKSTLVRLLLGLARPTAGHIERRPGLRVGYMPQRMPIDPSLPLTVHRLLALTRRVSAADARTVLRRVGVPELLEAPVQKLSGGEFQRVLLGRCLLGDPQLLVLDEPTQGVDFVGESDLYRLIADLRREIGCGILMVSHDLHLVMASTDRVLCLNRHVCCAGEPESVRQHPDYLALFGHRVGDGLAVYTHHHDHAHDLSGEVCLRTVKGKDPH